MKAAESRFRLLPNEYRHFHISNKHSSRFAGVGAVGEQAQYDSKFALSNARDRLTAKY